MSRAMRARSSSCAVTSRRTRLRDPPLAARPLLDLQLEALRLAHALLELGAGALQRHLVLAADGEVARDLGEAPAAGAAERRRHSAAEQQRAVLAHVPALVLGAALRLRAAELLLRRAAARDLPA